MKQITGTLLLVLFMFALFPSACAEDLVLFEDVFSSEEACTMDGPSTDALTKGYLKNLLYPGTSSSRSAMPLGDKLTGVNKTLYDLLKSGIAEIAAGDRQSTQFEFYYRDIFPQISFTEAELGTPIVVDKAISSAAVSAMKAKTTALLDIASVVRALLADSPYELYWFDKSGKGYTIGTSEKISATTKVLSFKPDVSMLTITMNVVQAYAVDYDPDPDIKVKNSVMNTTYGKSAAQAAVKARAITAANEGKSDYDRLLAYKNAICELASYNNEAAESTDMPYGDPWQMIWVFDDDPTTKVVCEGYAKAFKYLNDLSRSSVSTILVSGTMIGATGEGPHMWNVVTMDDNLRYLVDITNSDIGTVGYPDQLFLAGYDSGTLSSGYILTPNGNATLYGYDYETLMLFSEDELTLSDKDYMENLDLPRLQAEDRTVVILPEVTEHLRPTGAEFSFHLENYDPENSQDTPEYSLRHISGPELNPELSVSDDHTYGTATIPYENQPKESSVSVYEIRCTLGNTVYRKTCAITFTEDAMPTGSTLPDPIELQMGQTSQITVSFTPSEGWWEQAADPDILFDMSPEAFGDAFTYEVDRENVAPNAVPVTLIPQKPGFYLGWAGPVFNGIQYRDLVEVIVLDENGNLPQVTPEFDEIAPCSYAVVPENDDHLSADGWLFSFSLSNAELLRKRYGSVPVFTVEPLSGLPFDIDVHFYEDLYSGYVTTDRKPSQPCTAEFLVTASFGDVSSSTTASVTFREDVLPTGVAVPDVIELQLGQAYTCTAGFEPEEGWWTDPEYGTAIWFDGNYQDYVEIQITQPDQTHTGSAVLTPLQAGISQACVHVSTQGVTYSKFVAICIADESGNVPMPEPEFESVSEQRYVIIPQDHASISADPHLFSFHLANYDILAPFYEGDPVFTVTSSPDLTFDYHVQTWESGGEADAVAKPDAPCTAEFTVAVDWDGHQASTAVSVSFTEGPLPTGVAIPDNVHLQVGQESVFSPVFEPSDGWWNQTDYTRSLWIDGDIGSFALLEENFDGTVNGNTISVMPSEAGICSAHVVAAVHGLIFEKDIRVFIADADGYVPMPSPELEVHAEQHYAVPATSERLRDSSTLFTFSVANAGLLKEACAQSPVFTALQTGGDALSFEVVLWEDDPCGGYVRALQPVTSPSSCRFELTCTWGKESATVPCTVDYILDTLPSDLTVPDLVTVSLSDGGLDLTPGFLPENGPWSSSMADAGIAVRGADEYFDISENCSSQPMHLVLTPKKAGIVTGTVEVSCGTLTYSKPVLFKITDSSGALPHLTLPDGLTAIEDEAFLGTASPYIILPRSCTTIGARAFAGSGEIVVEIPGDPGQIAEDAFEGHSHVTFITNSPAAVAYAQSHAFLLIAP